ncbi:Cytochrome c oxidase subunit 3 [Anatilimnocola aggregata]|uniref:Cytochrome bo(3) ubiquinol oxidase subunit 3 n=1 Tax=Anatilimnocola aggregata TaxID=2528021 RepID=A0A517YDB0_9BACT|nr:heme-copper oxidase subunit III [Anatilimnocola aggregata]QDU28225.1 Cytochrome c oxidase subunit 3 [Anatilimnocola aggregata]
MSSTTNLAHEEHPLSAGSILTLTQMGMVAFLVSEVAFFSTLIVAYLTFLGKDTIGPTPLEALSLPTAIVSSVFLLASSGTIYLAEKQLHLGSLRGFQGWWTLTFLLGATFLAATAYEWSELIRVHQLTISRNLFGSTYYTLIGFHALHVSCGLVAMLAILFLSFRGDVKSEPGGGAELVSWYWHFVDCVWIVVFCIVYLWGR